MRTLQRIAFGLSLLAYAGLSVAPMLAAAQGFYGDTSAQYNVNSGGPQTVGGGYPQTAGGGSPQTVGGISNPLTDSSGHSITGVCQLLKIVLNIALLLGTPIAMLFIVYAGFKLVMARGNSAELTKARANLFWTLAGIAIFIGVWTFVQVLANTLGALGVQVLGSCS